jgi:hypothetical protein
VFDHGALVRVQDRALNVELVEEVLPLVPPILRVSLVKSARQRRQLDWAKKHDSVNNGHDSVNNGNDNADGVAVVRS